MFHRIGSVICIVCVFCFTGLVSCKSAESGFSDVTREAGIDFMYNFGDYTYENIFLNCEFNSNGENGFYSCESIWNTINASTLSNNANYGIHGWGSKNNSFNDNIFENNVNYSVILQEQCQQNKFTKNNFLFNNYHHGKQAAVGLNSDFNSWDDGAYGNHWSDWTTPDNNQDGIVDDRTDQDQESQH